MLGVGIGLSSTILGGRAFNPASVTPTAWYDPSDLTTLWQDSARTVPVTAHGDPVGCIDDKSGNGHHLTQTTAARRPLYQVSGAEKFLLFDGIDDVLARTVTFALPLDRITALRQINWTLNAFLIYAPSNVLLFQSGTTPTIGLRSGVATTITDGGLAVGSNGVVTERHAAAASRLAVNNGAYSGPTNVGSVSPTVMSIGASNTATGPVNMRWYGAILKAGAQFTDAQIANIRTHLGSKGSVPL